MRTRVFGHIASVMVFLPPAMIVVALVAAGLSLRTGPAPTIEEGSPAHSCDVPGCSVCKAINDWAEERGEIPGEMDPGFAEPGAMASSPEWERGEGVPTPPGPIPPPRVIAPEGAIAP